VASTTRTFYVNIQKLVELLKCSVKTLLCYFNSISFVAINTIFQKFVEMPNVMLLCFPLRLINYSFEIVLVVEATPRNMIELIW